MRRIPQSRTRDGLDEAIDHAFMSDLTRRQALRKGGAGLGLLALGPLLAACGSDDEDTSASGGSSTPKVDKIGFSHPFPGSDIYRPLRKGLREEAKARGITVLESQAEGKADKQLAEIRTWLSSGVKGITILNIAGEGLGPVVEKAHEDGAKIIGYASAIEGQDGQCVFDNKQGAQLVAEEASKYIKAQGLDSAKSIPIGLLTLDSLGETGTTRVGGCVDILKGMHSNIEVVGKAEGTNLAEPAQKATRSMIQAHPDIKMMICISDDGQVGAYQALKNVGKQQDVWLAGYDGSRVAMKMILDKEMIGCTAAIPLREIGKASVRVPVNAITGEGETDYAAPYELVSNDTPDLAKKLIADFA